METILCYTRGPEIQCNDAERVPDPCPGGEFPHYPAHISEARLKSSALDTG